MTEVVIQNVRPEFEGIGQVLKCLDTDFVDADLLIDGIEALAAECGKNVVNKYPPVVKFLQTYENDIKKLSKAKPGVDDYQVLKKLGQGAYGMVKLVKNKKTGQILAMKMMHKKATWENHERTAYMEERHVLANGDPTWITSLDSAFQDDNYLYLVMEFLQGGDLFGAIEKLDNLFTEEQAKFYAAEMVMAIDSIHKIGYVHRDIKLENFLVAKNGHLRLADFGTCIKVDETGEIKSNMPVGTAEYVAIEVLEAMYGGGTYSFQVDWWAMGVCIFEMFIGYLPFEGDSLSEINFKITNYKDNLKYPDDPTIEEDLKDPEFTCSQEFRDFINLMICSRAQRMKDATEIKNHPWFKGINFDSLQDEDPPLVPDVKDELDTSQFPDENEIEDPGNMYGNFTDNRSSEFTGSHLPFIGYTFTRTMKLKNKLNREDIPLSDSGGSQNAQLVKLQKQVSEKFEQKLTVVTKDLETSIEKQKGLDTQIELHKDEKKRLESEIKKLKEENTRLSESKGGIDKKGLKKELEHAEEEKKKMEDQLRKLKDELVRINKSGVADGKVSPSGKPGLMSGLKRGSSKKGKEEGKSSIRFSNLEDRGSIKEEGTETTDVDSAAESTDAPEDDGSAPKFRPEVEARIKRGASSEKKHKVSASGGVSVNFSGIADDDGAKKKSNNSTGLGRAKSVKYGGLNRALSTKVPNAAAQKNIAKIEQDLLFEKSARQEAVDELEELKIKNAELEEKYQDLEKLCEDLKKKTENRSTPELILDKVEDIEKQMAKLNKTLGSKANNTGGVDDSGDRSFSEGRRKESSSMMAKRRVTVRRPKSEAKSGVKKSDSLSVP